MALVAGVLFAFPFYSDSAYQSRTKNENETVTSYS